MESYDLAIIGTGSGNSILDERYADKRVAICEQGTFGGTCLNVGCIPTKMFVYAAEVAKTVNEATRYGVDARIDKVRWNDIVSRVFSRIDPIAAGGRSIGAACPTSTSTPSTPGSRRSAPTGDTCCAPPAASSSAPSRW